MDDQKRAETVADNISALSNALRIRILLALAETRQPDWTHRGMNYSELREAVGAEDGGRFNYHLDELTDQFVFKEDEQYQLTTAGEQIVDEIYAGTFSGAHEPVGSAIEHACPIGGEPISVTIEYGILVASCDKHDYTFDMRLPFNLVEGRTASELYEIAYERAYRYIDAVNSDICPHCGDRFEMLDVEHTDDRPDSGILLGYRCKQCGIAFRLPIESFASQLLPAVAFFYEHGIDVTSHESQTHYDRWSSDAFELEDGFLVSFEIDGDTLELELSQSFDIRDMSREQTTEPA